jgi:hypothetical protein
MNNDAWAALCAFARHPERSADPRERWEFTTTPKPKARKRKMTLVRAIRQAAKAGVAIRSAMLTPEGVELQLIPGDHFEAAPDKPNPWDTVQ